ncbi:MAG: hypothetical protein ACU843_19225, partial [Gammaproteobacteria bacterium]
ARGSQLIVKSSRENLAEIEQLIQQLDRKAAQFQISVLESGRLSLAELNASGNLYGGISSQSGIVGGSGHLYLSDSKSTGENIQQLRVMEGKAAHIQVGQSFPVPSYAYSAYGGIPYPTAGIAYQQATSGFAVIPQMAGDEVLLEVSPWSARFNRLGAGAIDTRSAHTSIRAPLGQWIDFGGQQGSSSGYGSGLSSHFASTGKNTVHLFLKVERLR